MCKHFADFFLLFIVLRFQIVTTMMKDAYLWSGLTMPLNQPFISGNLF